MNPNDYFHLIFDDNFGVTSLNIYWDSSVTSTAFFYLNKTEIETILSTDGKTKTGVYIYVNKKFVPPGSNAVFIWVGLIILIILKLVVLIHGHLKLSDLEPAQ